MSIDNCQYTPDELWNKVIPEDMERLNMKMQQPLDMAQFSQSGIGIKSIANQLGYKKDFSGCYVLLDHQKPIYVGISRSVIQRLQQHVKGSTHSDASLAYRMTADEIEPTGTRDQAMDEDRFNEVFDEKKKYLTRLKVAFTEIRNPVELYLFEVYCAMDLDTSKWNTFQTH